MTAQFAPPVRMLPAALALAARGIVVFPVRVASKKPMVPWGREATTDPQVIGRWWTRWPYANIGVACKPSGLTIVDVDGPAGRASWAALTRQHGHNPTVSVTTGRTDGGVHYWYRAPAVNPPGNSKGSDTSGIAPGIDLRGAGAGDGGMAIAPPSLHGSGRRYRWADRLPLVDLPTWLHQRAARPTTPAPSIPTQAAARRRAAAYQSRPELAESRAHRWAAAVLAGETTEIAAMAPESGRSDALNGAAYKLGRLVAGGLLDADDVRRALIDAGVAAGLDDPARGGKNGSAARTVASGLRAGQRRPRTCREDR